MPFWNVKLALAQAPQLSGQGKGPPTMEFDPREEFCKATRRDRPFASHDSLHFVGGPHSPVRLAPVAVFVLICMLATACGSTSQKAGSKTGANSRLPGPKSPPRATVVPPAEAVPFSDRPAADKSQLAFFPTIGSAIHDAEPCRANSLQLEASSEPAVGTIYGSLTVTNTATRPCRVRGIPDVQLINDRGKVIQQSSPTSTPGGIPPVVLMKGGQASAVLGPIDSNVVCGAPRSSKLRLLLADGFGSKTVSLPNGGQDLPCDSASKPESIRTLIAESFVPSSQSTFSGPADPMRTLKATLQIPMRVKQGETLNYSIVLNKIAYGDPQIDYPARFAPGRCPSYSEALLSSPIDEQHVVVEEQHLLNCEHERLIEVGHSMRFMMQLKVPVFLTENGTLGGQGFGVRWQMTDPLGPRVVYPLFVEY